MPARATRRDRAADPATMAAMIQIATDPDRYRTQGEEIAAGKAEVAELRAAVDADRARLNEEHEQLATLKQAHAERGRDLIEQEKRQQTKQAELESREAVCVEVERRLNADRERVNDAAAKLVAVLRGKFETFVNDGRGSIANSMETVS
jgi:chromosome segregation ATPase